MNVKKQEYFNIVKRNLKVFPQYNNGLIIHDSGLSPLSDNFLIINFDKVSSL